MDVRPANCRFRLQDEGKPYGRSSCSACGKGIFSGLGNQCSVAPDLMAELVEAATAFSVAYRTWSLIPRRRDGEKQAFEQMHTCKVALDAALAKIKEPQT